MTTSIKSGAVVTRDFNSGMDKPGLSQNPIHSNRAVRSGDRAGHGKKPPRLIQIGLAPGKSETCPGILHYITPPASPRLEPFGSFPVWMDGGEFYFLRKDKNK
ncbi:hypothetical protein AVEN_171496-1 [Araneus ventricosus]|uniref:Uncharacterized protein n=1 Tax=Araneus ventricosus TaxID=182803 RepID=A0A4Y2HB31_ARAVE|nr:hypothetical protein AVEN_171496-1 [Araneus ventricosus]